MGNAWSSRHRSTITDVNTNRLELLIYGFIRNNHPRDILIPDSIQRLCFQYAESSSHLVREWIYGVHRRDLFYILDVTTSEPVLYSDSDSVFSDDSDRILCLIPYLSSKQIQRLFPSQVINPMHSFIGIFNSTAATKHLRIFRIIDNVPVLSHDDASINPMMELQNNTARCNNIKFDYLIYCGCHGLIGITNIHSCLMYQLKLDDIDQEFKFRKMNNIENGLYLEILEGEMFEMFGMQYLERRDVIVAGHLRCDCIYEFHQFDFEHHQWTTIKLDTTTIMENKYPLNWRYCYDRDDDALYFVSDELHVLRYEMESGSFELILDKSQFDLMFIRAVWMGHSTSSILCIWGESGKRESDLPILKQINLNQINTKKKKDKKAIKAWKPYAEDCVEIRTTLNGIHSDGIFQ